MKNDDFRLTNVEFITKVEGGEEFDEGAGCIFT